VQDVIETHVDHDALAVLEAAEESERQVLMDMAAAMGKENP
jgi:hypothetical protein